VLRSKNALLSIISGTFTAVIGIAVISWWLTFDATAGYTLHLPNQDGQAAAAGAAEASFIAIGKYFKYYGDTFTPLPGEWPRFRGGSFDNISREDVPLASTWGVEGPPVLWQVTLGEGHAAPAVADGKVYLLDYDEIVNADSLRCFSLDKGKELWRRWYLIKIRRNHGRSRTIPAVSASLPGRAGGLKRYVVTIGPCGQVMCVDAQTGEFIWGIDLEREYGAKVPLWYTAQCPLIDKDIVVLAPCGEVLMLGVSVITGEVLWKTPNTPGFRMSHTSIMPMTIGNREIYVYSAIGGICGVAANGDKRGQLLFHDDAWNHDVIAPSPVTFPDGRIFLTAGYGAGSMMLRISEYNNGFHTEMLYEHTPREGLACEQQTPLLYKGFLFGILPNDAGPLKSQFVCYNPEGDFRWASGKEYQFGLGPFLAADNLLFILKDNGTLLLAEASVDHFVPLSSAKVLDGNDAWGPLALASGRLLVRDSRQLVCLDVSEEGNKKNE
jgi:outer membrane protein assembly factor BamB